MIPGVARALEGCKRVYPGQHDATPAAIRLLMRYDPSRSLAQGAGAPGLPTGPLPGLQQPVGAQEEVKKLGWSSTAEFNFVMTAGNSESTTLGFNGSAERAWTKALLQIKAGALKVETTSDLGVAIGTGQDDFTVPEVTATTAENYYLGGKYDHNIGGRLYWYVAAGWLRKLTVLPRHADALGVRVGGHVTQRREASVEVDMPRMGILSGVVVDAVLALRVLSD